MADRVLDTDDGHESIERYVYPVVTAILLVLSVPLNAGAVQVGCFVTAVLLGFMFLLSLCITLVFKSLLARRVGGAPKTPWKRILALTVIELFLFVLVFAVTRTSFFVTLLIYLPFAAVINGLLLSKPLQSLAAAAPLQRRILLFALLSLSLPAAIQIAGLIWSAITGVITSTEFHT